MIDTTQKPTEERVKHWVKCYTDVINFYGEKAGDALMYTIDSWRNTRGNVTEREVYDYAIYLAEAKLNAPVIVLDPTEYEDAMKGEEIISSFGGAGL